MMQTMVPLYGFGGGSGGTGAALTVNAPAGCTVTVSKDGKTKTKTAGTDGVAVFKGLATGQWTVNMTDGAQTAPTRTADITADYAITMSFFSATIHVTYPAGSTCTATDGVTTLTAPDTSGTWDCVVPNAGTWMVAETRGTHCTVDITDNGQVAEADITKLWVYNNGLINTELFGDINVVTYGGYNGSLTKGENTITLKGSSTASSGVAAFSEKFVNNGYKTLFVNVVSFSGTEPRALAFSTLSFSDINSAAAAWKIIAENGVNQVSIDGIGEFYIGLSAFKATLVIDKIWLE